jgi:hypothetical protein
MASILADLSTKSQLRVIRTPLAAAALIDNQR